ncbi:MAG TPA: hypothetical protein VEN78_40140 [Bradyrhizobium sp.]|nr:hypothetical protein [Bradyrhizobium sp.]
MQDHFLSKARLDIFRPFTGRHRAVFFEVVTEIYERTLGLPLRLGTAPSDAASAA